MSVPSEKVDDARGRSAVSKPLGESASTSATSTSKPAILKADSGAGIASGSADAPTDKVENALVSSSDDLDDNWGGFKVTKTSSETVTLNTSWKPRPLAPQHPVPMRPAHKSLRKPKAKATESIDNSIDNDIVDPLEAAAEKHAWQYMLADIDDTFRDAEAKAAADIQTRETALALAEEEVADQRERHEAQRTLAFLDEVAQESLATQAPEVMVQFHAHADECSRVETEALALVNAITHPKEATDSSEEIEDETDSLKPYSDILQRLEDLHKEAIALQAAFVDLTEKTSQQTIVDEQKEGSGDEDEEAARVHVHAIFSSCGPVLNARIANLTLAQELVDTALQNVTLGLRMESMGIS